MTGRRPLPTRAGSGLWVKICGVTHPDDARRVAEAGADAIGLVLWPQSPRAVGEAEVRACVAAVADLPVAVVGVFVDGAPGEAAARATEWGLHTLQWHGPLDDAGVAALDRAGLPWLALLTADRQRALVAGGDTLPVERRAGAWLVDAPAGGQPGGTGRVADWSLAARLPRVRPLVLAGGLTSDTVSKAIGQVRPDGVDVSSGVARPGSPRLKSDGCVRRFVRRARGAIDRQASQEERT